MLLQWHAAVPGFRVGLVEVAERLEKFWLIMTCNGVMEFFYVLVRVKLPIQFTLGYTCKRGWKYRYLLLSANANSYLSQSIWVGRRNCIIIFFTSGSWDTLSKCSPHYPFPLQKLSYLALLKSISILLLLLTLIPEEVLSEQLGLPSHFEGSLHLILYHLPQEFAIHFTIHWNVVKEMELLTEKAQGKGRIRGCSVQLFDKMIFLEDTQYLVHCTKTYRVQLTCPVFLGGSQGSVAAVHINPEEFCTSGRAWATAFLFPRAAAVQPTHEHCFWIRFSTRFCSFAQFCKQHPIVIFSSTTTETGKAFNRETCTESESSQHFCAIHLPVPPAPCGRDSSASAK